MYCIYQFYLYCTRRYCGADSHKTTHRKTHQNLPNIRLLIQFTCPESQSKRRPLSIIEQSSIIKLTGDYHIKSRPLR